MNSQTMIKTASENPGALTKIALNKFEAFKAAKGLTSEAAREGRLGASAVSGLNKGRIAGSDIARNRAELASATRRGAVNQKMEQWNKDNPQPVSKKGFLGLGGNANAVEQHAQNKKTALLNAHVGTSNAAQPMGGPGTSAAGSLAPGATFAQHAKNFYNNKILPNKKPLMIAGGVAAAGGLAMHAMGNNQQQPAYAGY